MQRGEKSGVIQPRRFLRQCFQRGGELPATVILEFEYGGVEFQPPALFFAQIKAQP
jgi:hypothetical protein